MGKYNKKGSDVKFVGGVFTKEQLDERKMSYYTHQPTNKDGTPNKSFVPYGNVWVRRIQMINIQRTEEREAAKAVAEAKAEAGDDGTEWIKKQLKQAEQLEAEYDAAADAEALAKTDEEYIYQLNKSVQELRKNYEKGDSKKPNNKEAKAKAEAKAEAEAKERLLKNLEEKTLKNQSLRALSNNVTEEKEARNLKKYNFSKLYKNYIEGKNAKLNEEAEEEAVKAKEEAKELEYLLNQFDGDSKFPSSFESLLSAYSLMENINRNYRDLRPIFNNLSVPVYNDLKDILDDSNDLISKSIKSLYGSKSLHTQKNIFNNLNDFNDKLNSIINTFESIYNDFQQRKQTFNTNIRAGSGFGYLSKIRNI